MIWEVLGETDEFLRDYQIVMHLPVPWKTNKQTSLHWSGFSLTSWWKSKSWKASQKIRAYNVIYGICQLFCRAIQTRNKQMLLDKNLLTFLYVRQLCIGPFGWHDPCCCCCLLLKKNKTSLCESWLQLTDIELLSILVNSMSHRSRFSFYENFFKLFSFVILWKGQSVFSLFFLQEFVFYLILSLF